ncbi:T-cell activation inhibitor, mitochondrial-like protein [Plakobranchus ocellatus]|uniref:T-cell activation inhibitor, mitochondrial-like protein n=1 Tax=Plakobranchus ocellatus TaxID=259542 RepID=A0AAV4BQ40_9GAST|nr:T-cell activation inhibitor, mitochondrial-like protein [Plakobranchus ocellatus]
MLKITRLGRCLSAICSPQPLVLTSLSAHKFTAQDASAALRPFFFIVHPDLFGQHPIERSVNENSLKCLNEFLNSPAGPRRGQPQKLVFYIRATNSFGEETLREVKITLSTTDLRTAVMKILNCFGLSDSHVPQGDTDSYHSTNRPIDWHPSFYTAMGREHPYNRHSRPIVLTLRGWLKMNIDRSRSHQAGMRYIQDDIARLLHKFQADLGLKAVRFDSAWGIQHFRGCLKSFDRLFQTHPQFLKYVLKGKTLVFSNSTGVSRLGEIILSSEDVPQAWIKMLKSVGAYEAVLARLPMMEAKVSKLLNGTQVVRLEKRLGHVMAEDYEVLLNRLINSLRRCQDHVHATFGQTDLSNLQIRVEGESNPLMVSSLGQFIIPASVPGTMVVDFIQENMEQAQLILKDITGLLDHEEKSRVEALQCLGLLELQKDESVTPAQMVSCCSRLMEESWRLLDLPTSTGGVSLQGSRLRVSHYYSVMQDGLICIPWDWVGEDDL